VELREGERTLGYIYIYIYRERERERESNLSSQVYDYVLVLLGD
jgi:hypothetical protein